VEEVVAHLACCHEQISSEMTFILDTGKIIFNHHYRGLETLHDWQRTKRKCSLGTRNLEEIPVSRSNLVSVSRSMKRRNLINGCFDEMRKFYRGVRSTYSGSVALHD
jgi:hypothetical protein